jgi:hypothetical protein
MICSENLRAFEEKIIPTNYITSIKDMYINIMTDIKTYDDKFNTFFIKMKLH